MGLFSFFNRKNGTANQAELTIASDKLPSVTEEKIPGDNLPEVGINLLFQLLEKNYETKGYNDALINADNTHLDQNIQALRNDLERTIKKVKTFYEDFIREINFHIGSRSRSGMVDTVEELTVKKETAENHIKQIIEIENDAKNNKGVGQGVIISYTRGFRNGLAAISHHSIMKRTL